MMQHKAFVLSLMATCLILASCVSQPGARSYYEEHDQILNHTHRQDYDRHRGDRLIIRSR